MNILIDCMGGDLAPYEIVKGGLESLKENKDHKLTMIGNSDQINDILKNQEYDNSRIEIIHTETVITNDDKPTKAIREKKDSSMVVGLNMLKENKGDVFLSAGNTGALMAGSLFILGRIDGVDRPALVSPLPTKTGVVLLLDSGANTLCKPINYVQFGIMGSLYSKEVFNVSSPKVGLINVGTEEKKGNDTLKQAYTELSSSGINFIGNVEGREILEGNVDVAVCDGFVGNVVLKFLEGVGSFVFDELKSVYSRNIFSQISALMIKSGLRRFKNKLDYKEYGGVPLLGVKGKVVKSHGSSDAKAIKNSILISCNFAKSYIIQEFTEKFKNMEVQEIEQQS